MIKLDPRPWTAVIQSIFGPKKPEITTAEKPVPDAIEMISRPAYCQDRCMYSVSVDTEGSCEGKYCYMFSENKDE
jgi:hypothetical protein